VSGQQHAPAALYPRERPGTHFTGGWVGRRTGLDRGKNLSPQGFDPGSSSPWSVAIPTELPGPHLPGFHKENLPVTKLWQRASKDKCFSGEIQGGCKHQSNLLWVFKDHKI